ncbi:DNA damage-inducible protein 1, putative [Hepatocystis sp. ex Piliocolobus tephrosceles]|nr:DNA damage-inducible protein 1, putative [Hepatocystis sp. ex Piliocolobus tephrosceles]
MVFITISDDSKIITSLDVHEDTIISTVMNIIENDFNIDMNINELTHNGNVLDQFATIKQSNISEGELLFVRKKLNFSLPNNNLNNNTLTTPNNNNSNVRNNNMASLINTLNTLYPQNNSNPTYNSTNIMNNPGFTALLEQFQILQENEQIKKDAEVLLQLKNDNNRMNVLKLQDINLYNAINEQNLEKIKKIVREKMELEKKEKQKELQMYENALKNPLSEESQKFIYEYIYKNQINSNLELAQEHFPEAFGVVHMLYIPAEINKKIVRAFVDSGAQASIMSKRCAEQCNILRLMDKRFTGIAKGVGTKNILGKIHMIDIKIGNCFYAVSLTIIDEYDLDFIFGLDMLRRHQCSIDLKKNALIIENNEIPFLSEKDTLPFSVNTID